MPEMKSRDVFFLYPVVFLLVCMAVLGSVGLALRHYMPVDDASAGGIALPGPAILYPRCINHYISEGIMVHSPPCGAGDLGYIDAAHVFHFMSGITPEEREQSVPHLRQNLNGVKIDLSRCNECGDEDEGHPLHA